MHISISFPPLGLTQLLYFLLILMYIFLITTPSIYLPSLYFSINLLACFFIFPFCFIGLSKFPLIFIPDFSFSIPFIIFCRKFDLFALTFLYLSITFAPSSLHISPFSLSFWISIPLLSCPYLLCVYFCFSLSFFPCIFHSIYILLTK